MIYASSEDTIKKKLSRTKTESQANCYRVIKDQCALTEKLVGSAITSLEHKLLWLSPCLSIWQPRPAHRASAGCPSFQAWGAGRLPTKEGQPVHPCSQTGSPPPGPFTSLSPWRFWPSQRAFNSRIPLGLKPTKCPHKHPSLRVVRVSVVFYKL